MKKTMLLAGLLASFALSALAADAQTGDARRIEGQAGIDTEHHFRMTLPSGWRFDPITSPASVPCFSFTHRSDPKRRGQMTTLKRLHNETARTELENWLAESREWVEEGDFYEASPVVDTRLGGEEAVSCVETFQDDEGVRRKGIGIFAVKGQGIYHLSVSAPADRFDALQADVEFIKKNLRFL